MRNELYCYATSLKDKSIQKIPSICFWILLSIFLVPILLTNMIVGLVLPFAFILFYFVIRKETDLYSKELLRITLYLLFLGVEFSVLTEFQYNITVPLIASIVMFLISYEIVFVVNIRRNAYSGSNLKKWTNVVPLIFGETGVWAGKLIAQNDNIETKLFIVVLICSSLIMYSFTFFQRFIFYKIIK